MLLALMEEGQWPLEAGEGQEMGSPLKPPDRTGPAETVGLLTDRTARQCNCVVLSPCVCGHLQ